MLEESVREALGLESRGAGRGDSRERLPFVLAHLKEGDVFKFYDTKGLHIIRVVNGLAFLCPDTGEYDE